MATRTGAVESIITLKEPFNELGHTLTGSVSGAQVMVRSAIKHTNSRRRKWPFRSIGSSSLLLILTWQFIIQCSIVLTVNRMFKEDKEDSSISPWLTSKALIGIATVSFTCPIASLLAEVLISRYKLVSFSLRAMWLLSVVASLISVCEETLPVDKTTLLTIEISLFLIPQFSFVGVFIATAVPLAMDQINGGSNANISAFLQWLNWTFLSGTAIPNILGSVLYSCSYFEVREVSMLMSLLSVLLLSMGLIVDFCFHHKLVKEPVTVNPVSLIFKVLKYAVKHKHPVQRSAFTYCENEQPTRLDYGKSKYGGPFTTEQVEDVKTFWRILLVILVVTIVIAPLTANATPAFKNSVLSQVYCIQNILHNLNSCSSLVMFSIPLYELLIYPCLRNRSPSILKSAGIGAAGVIALSLYGIAAESVRPFVTDSTNECVYLQQGHNLNKIEVGIEIPFNILFGLTYAILNKTYVEFICAQAPYNMNSLLVGILVILYFLQCTLGGLLYEAWSKKFTTLDTSRCGIWFYVTTLILAVVSSALMGLVIRWYKARERDEIISSQDLVEQVYDKYKEQEQRE